jgi:hypothetical protein
MYLNGYVPSLQSGGGVVYFMRQHLGARVPSTMMAVACRIPSPPPTAPPAIVISSRSQR